MTEEFLHHIWKFRLFNQTNLRTTQGDLIEIIKVGRHNLDAGPDFFNANIKIGETLWAGNIEIHLKSSDWKKHSHHTDISYDNIILHIVYQNDTSLFRKSGEAIPTLELKSRIDNSMYEKYSYLKSNSNWIPCETQIHATPLLILNNTIDKLLIERLEKKSISILNNLKLNKHNWEESFYQQTARNFGFKINGLPFELLAKSLPINILAKHKHNLLQTEALLFGQAGWLNITSEDKYINDLKKEYNFLKQKYKLVPLENHLWKFLRLRPHNFPTIRIAQFAKLIHNSSHLFSKIVANEEVESLKRFLNISVSEYWETHFVFEKVTKKTPKHFGNDSINNLIINTVVPFLFIYGKEKGEEKYCTRALAFLEALPVENNSIIKKWFTLIKPNRNAYTTQALLQLKTEYCDPKKCLSCNIGNYLLKKGKFALQ